MDRAVFDSVEREIDDEARARFPGDAIRLVLPRFREQPEYEQLRELVREIDRLRAEC